jgi:hypothetical protein
MAINLDNDNPRKSKWYESFLWLHDRNPSGTWADNVPVSVCLECHALVLDMEEHKNWHEEVNRKTNRLTGLEIYE